MQKINLNSDKADVYTCVTVSDITRQELISSPLAGVCRLVRFAICLQTGKRAA